MSTFAVSWAYYGSTPTQTNCQVNDVTATLQDQLNDPIASPNGVLTINDTNMGGDPSPGNTKAFCASVSVDGSTASTFICSEGQTVDFSVI
jgi:hypothetical protein